MMRTAAQCTLATTLVIGAACTTENASPPPTSSSSATTATSSSSATTSSGGGMGGQGGVGMGGTSGTGGTGGSGPMGCQGPKTGNDVCDGELFNLPLGTTHTLCGSMDAGTGAELQGAGCVLESNPSKDRVYRFVTNDSGVLTVDVRPDAGSLLDPFVYLRLPNSCSDAGPAASSGCFAGFPLMRFDWDGTFIPGGFNLIVEGGAGPNQNQLTGDYILEVSLLPDSCGNRHRGPNEPCDDGANAVSGDGCDATCMLTPVTTFDTCPGRPINAPALPHMEPGNTSFNTDDHSPPSVGTCGSVSSGGHDEVFRYTATANALITAVVGLDPTCGAQTECLLGGLNAPSCWNHVLWVNEGTCTGTTLGCSDATTSGTESVTFTATAGTDYFIYVDGFDGTSQGNYYLCLF